jgi:glutamate:GABA antiporter
MAVSHPDAVATAEIDAVQAHSAAFRKELGLRDLVLTQILYVVGSGWVGTAAKLGQSQVVFWLLAILLYYLPQAAVVIYLNRLMPLEGGLYQWAKVGINELAGFLVAWNLWAYTIVLIATFGIIIATTFSYVLGPDLAWLTGSKWYDALVIAALVAGMITVSTFGLKVGKWVHNLGGATQLLVFGALVAVPFLAVARGTLPEYHPLAATFPTFSLLNLNIFGKLAMGALSGFEWVAILAGESRNPGRTIGRSVIIATPLIAAMFILGTSSVLAFVENDRIDLISPIPQALGIGLRGFGVAAYIVPALTLMLFVRQVANVNLLFTGNTRLPLVAGWDGLLPAWFTRLHPRYRTPLNSILFVGAVVLALGFVSLVGVGQQEAFQLLDNAAGILYALAYLVMFALPLVGLRHIRAQAPLWLRLAAASGFLVTLLYTVLSVFPIIDVASWALFAAKILVVIIGANTAGVAIYLAARRRQRR